MIRIKRAKDGWHFVLVTRRVRTSAGPHPTVRDASAAAFATLRKVEPTFPGDYVRVKGKLVRHTDEAPRVWRGGRRFE